MASKKLTTLQRRNILFDEAHIDTEEDKILDEYNGVKSQFIAPSMGESYKEYANSYLNMELLERGEQDVLKYQESINGQVLHPIYELIRTNSLTPETLASNSDKWDKDSAESKYMFLMRRYYAENGIVRDRRKGDKIVCEPLCIFDLIMCAHLMNDHMTYRPIYTCLNKIYSNITRDFVQMAVRYCSSCNPDGHFRPLEKYRHKNIFKGLLPLERVHIEIFEVFDNESISNKFTNALYCRDYHTRFVWLAPLKNTKFKHLVSAVGTLLLGMTHVPIFMESSTLDKQDLFDICEQLCGKYDMKLGLGANNSSQFHINGIKRMKKLLNARKVDCISDWNMCLRYGPYHLNRRHNTLAGGIPNDLLYHSDHTNRKHFRPKQEMIIDELPAQNVVHVNKGLLYLEDENSDVFEEEEEQVDNESDDSEMSPGLPTGIIINSATQTPERSVEAMHHSPEISEPNTSFYQELVSPSKKRPRLAQ